MEALFGTALNGGTLLMLVLALLLALAFEFVNGFHDTANAVATVIYTKSLRPTQAVIWSGTWNFIGMLSSSGAVAFGIIALLPAELVVNIGSGAGFAMVFALLLSAILWSLGTWYFGLPASSSHTLIGSIIGVGLAHSALSAGGHFGEGINWSKVGDAGLALLISPLIGFFVAGGLLILARYFLKRRPDIFRAPQGEQAPTPWIRGLLLLTCTGVSFAHGSNDGQKGMGLIMLILIGIVPGIYALDLGADNAAVARLSSASHAALAVVDHASAGARRPDEAEAQAALARYLRSGQAEAVTLPALAVKMHSVEAAIAPLKTLQDIPEGAHHVLRADFILVEQSLGKLNKAKAFGENEQKITQAYQGQLKALTTFIPFWVKAAVALALGLGTMIGWRRIVLTVGEKIGKAHLTYAQGASAEVVAMLTIGAADTLGLPVSTTHVLSSGVAGTMFANNSGLQKNTLRHIMLAWVLTIPVCIFLGALMFSAGLLVAFKLFGAH